MTQPTLPAADPRPDAPRRPDGVSATRRPDGVSATRRRYDSQDLFGAAVEIEIAHQQQVYRLRRTSLGKLILTK